jgi:hypothetical protein
MYGGASLPEQRLNNTLNNKKAVQQKLNGLSFKFKWRAR